MFPSLIVIDFPKIPSFLTTISSTFMMWMSVFFVYMCIYFIFLVYSCGFLAVFLRFSAIFEIYGQEWTGVGRVLNF